MQIDPNRRETALPRRKRSAVDGSTDPATASAHPSIRGLATASVERIDQLILELERMRGVLHHEGKRLNHEISRYAGTNQSLFATIKVVRETIEPGAESLCMVRRPPPFEHI